MQKNYLILNKKYFLNHQIVKIFNAFFILLVNQEHLKTGHMLLFLYRHFFNLIATLNKGKIQIRTDYAVAQ